MKVAVVGSGIAGLSVARLLSRNHEVTIFEKSTRLGMDAHSLNLQNPIGDARIDVPLRVFFDGFYPNLTALYRELEIDFKPINYAASFGYFRDETYFRFDNYRLGRYTVPFLKGLRSFGGKALRIGWDIVRFFREIPRSLANGIADDTTLEDYLQYHQYSHAFAHGFLYPAFAGICTCSHDSIRRYPARVVLEYLNSGILLSSVQRVTRGTQEVVELLARDVQQICLGEAIGAVAVSSSGVTLSTDD
ncbi:MAG: FAD-dependent oxidoreductase, partial [Pseudomonadota bacterium]